MQKKLLILAIVALVLVAGAFLVWQKKQELKNQKLSQKSTTEVVSQDQQLSSGVTPEIESIKDLIDGDYTFVAPVDTSNWKTYRNEEVGFETKIPNDWFCGGVALAPSLTSQHVCLGEKERKSYYEGKYAGNNLIMINILDFEGDSLRERVELEKKRNAKIYTVKINSEVAILTIDKYYIHIFDVSNKWSITRFSSVNNEVFDFFVSNFKFIR